MCFHSTSAAQTKKLESNFYQTVIENKLEELKVRYNIEEFDYSSDFDTCLNIFYM